MTSGSDVAASQARAPWIASILIVAAVSILLTISLQVQNPRVLVSWHGFLHTAIANRFPGPFHAPENPFFAGERLPYYWFHHYVAEGLARALNLHPIRVFQIVTAAGLALLWIGAGAIGVRRLGSLNAGLLIGFLVLAGVNPLGPLIAGSRYVVQGQQLFTAPPVPGPRDTVFVSDRESEALMTQPLLPALYVSADWRRGQNVTWYLDNSSRGLAIALVFALLYALTGRASGASLLFAGLMAAAATAMSPLIGLAAVGSLFGGALAVAALRWFRRNQEATSTTSTLAIATAAAVGALAASPTYFQLFVVGGSGMQLFVSRESLLRVVALAFNVVLLLPLAAWGAFRAPRRLRDHCGILFVAACALLAVVPFVSLTDDTEHNLVNTAECLLVIPAVAAITTARAHRLVSAFVVASCIPMMCGTLVSFVGRPSLPVAFDRSDMHRWPDDSLERLYRWIRAATPLDSVFVADPTMPVKMSGNVAELPAFTARTLFTDQASYLTTPHKDFEQRRTLSAHIAQGGAMSAAEIGSLVELNRPAYLVSYQADQAETLARLVDRIGYPVFHDGFVAVFNLDLLLDRGRPEKMRQGRP